LWYNASKQHYKGTDESCCDSMVCDCTNAAFYYAVLIIKPMKWCSLY